MPWLDDHGSYRIGCKRDRRTTIGAFAGEGGITSPIPAEPAARAELAQAPPSAPVRVAGTGNRLAWLDVLRGLAALAVVFTSNLWSPRLIALVADLAVMAGLAFAVVLRGTSRLAGAAVAWP